ncbi:MAG: NAC family transcription factor [Methanoregula sp.]|nr:NAC family transcription factor [Methanoregula sp.]
MGGNDQDGYYCTICGGIPPDKITTKKILIDGKETGIDQLDWIIAEVRKLNLSEDTVITEELLKRTRALNYVPTKKAKEYGEALLTEYKKSGGVTGA